MMLEFTVGINIAGKHESVTVAAEDALIAALKVKCERPDALINYVRRRNKRGDLRHPHGSMRQGRVVARRADGTTADDRKHQCHHPRHPRHAARGPLLSHAGI